MFPAGACCCRGDTDEKGHWDHQVKRAEDEDAWCDEEHDCLARICDAQDIDSQHDAQGDAACAEHDAVVYVQELDSGRSPTEMLADHW